MDDVALPADRLAHELRCLIGGVAERVVDAHDCAGALEFCASRHADDRYAGGDDALDRLGTGDRVDRLDGDALDPLGDEAVDDGVLLDLVEVLRRADLDGDAEVGRRVLRGLRPGRIVGVYDCLDYAEIVVRGQCRRCLDRSEV